MSAGFANAVNRSRVGKWAAERLLGIDRRREVPAFSRSLYRRWEGEVVRAEAIGGGGGDVGGDRRSVALFADCFTAYNEPGIGVAAGRLLRRLGYEVRLSGQGGLVESAVCAVGGGGGGGGGGGCCGRSMISVGLLEDAAAEIDATLELLRPMIEDDSVRRCLCVSRDCLSAMTDDWLSLRKLRTPVDVRKKLAAKAMLVEDFVDRYWDEHPVRPWWMIGWLVQVVGRACFMGIVIRSRCLVRRLGLGCFGGSLVWVVLRRLIRRAAGWLVALGMTRASMT